MQPVDLADQAAGLRRLLGEQEAFCAAGVFGPDALLTASTTAGLAFALARRGSQTCVFDALPGTQHVAAHLGLAVAAPGLGVVASGRASPSAAFLHGPGGIRIMGAEGALERVATLPERAWQALGEAFDETACEWLLITAPDDGRLSMALACPLRLLVMPAARNRLPETYAVLKAAHQQQPDGRWRVLVVDAASEDQAEQLMAALKDTAQRFLDVPLDYAGAVPRDAMVAKAALAMRPLLDASPQTPAAQALRGIAEAMPGWMEDGQGMGRAVFWQRLGLFSRMASAVFRTHDTPHRHDRVYG